MLDQRTFLREVHDSPIVHIEANRREKGHVAVLLAQHDRCHISLVLDAGTYIGDLIGRHAPSLKHLVQGGSLITFEFLRHGNDGSVLFDQQRAEQRNLRARLARIQKLLRFHDAAQHADHAPVAIDGLGYAEVVAVQAVRLAHVGHHRLACVQMPKRFLVPLVAIARNALLQLLDWSIGNLERPLLVPFLQIRSERRAGRIDVRGLGQHAHGGDDGAHLADERLDFHLLRSRVVVHADAG